FLHPLPVERLWGVGPATAGKLHAVGIRTVGDVASVPEEALVLLLGRAVRRHLHALAHNRDPRRVETGRRRRSIGPRRRLRRRRPRLPPRPRRRAAPSAPPRLTRVEPSRSG